MKSLKYQSIRTSFILCSMVLLIPVIVSFITISFKFTKQTALDNSQEYTTQLINQLNGSLNNYIEYMENISGMIIYNSDTRSYLTADYENRKELKRTYQNIVNQFATIMDVRKDIYCIAACSNNGRLVMNQGLDKVNPNISVTDMQWYQEAMKADGAVVLISSHVQNIIQDKYRWVVTLCRAIKDPVTNEKIGALMVDLKYDSITDLCDSIDLGRKGYIFVLDNEGNLVYHPKQQLIYSGLLQERISEVQECKENSFIAGDSKKGRLYTLSRSEVTGWTVVGVANLQELFQNKQEAVFLYVFFGTTVALLAIVLSIMLSNRITRPITRLKESMKEVEKGNFGLVTPASVSDTEIGRLGRSFNIMVDKIQTLMEEQITNQKKKRKSELLVLQSQINPHFLYNTLDSIVWMAEGGKNEEVVVMTSSLAKLLRQSISNEAEFVTIRQEVEYVKSYLTIQKMRYKDQLNYEVDLEKAVESFPIVKLVLQPLVENAIYHGIKYKEGGGFIWIRGYELDDTIVIEVEDNGIGMDENQVRHIFDKKEANLKSNGVGVCNVNQRIKLHYGEEYGLIYESEISSGTRVSIVIPKEQKEEANEA